MGEPFVVVELSAADHHQLFDMAHGRRLDLVAQEIIIQRLREERMREQAREQRRARRAQIIKFPRRP